MRTINPQKPEEIAAFFDARAGGYDEHMRALGRIEEFYQQVAAVVPETRKSIALLDLGCGTGLELPGILARAPHAAITALDASRGMLDELKRKHAEYLPQITLMLADYETAPLSAKAYDCVISVMSLHHLPHRRKLRLYRKIRRALKETGRYIEGDYVVPPVKEREFLKARRAALRSYGLARKETYHLDIPFSSTTQVRLLRRAGFARVDIVWEGEEKAVFVATGALASEGEGDANGGRWRISM